jgi:preprotein translocase subunit YajC
MEIALIYFAVLALAFFVLIVRPQRRRAEAHRQFVASLAPGDKVVTSGGIFGTIRSLHGEVVDLEVTPAMVITVARAAIAQPAAAFTRADAGPTESDLPPGEPGG